MMGARVTLGSAMSEIRIKQTVITPEGSPVYESQGDDGHIVAIPEDGEVFIPAVMSGDNTQMKALVDAVVAELGNNSLCFTNVINSQLKDALDGFEEEQEYAEQYGEYVTVLRGEWEA